MRRTPEAGGPPEPPSTPETSQEKEHFEPTIRIDLVRHGEAEYSDELEQQVEAQGYPYDKLFPASKTTAELRGTRAGKEGRLTKEGRAQLTMSMEHLAKKIDPANEVIIVLSSPQLRAEESAGVVIDALKQQGVDILGAREHLDLIDMQRPWIGILQFLKQSPSGESPFKYWLQMSEEELQEADIEGIKSIEDRTGHFIKLIQALARLRRVGWGLDKKTLRVIAVTHDINLIAIAGCVPGLSKKELNDVKHAEIVELGMDDRGDAQLITDDETA
ncbi:MAG: hypothetical protein WC553_00580 [Patescibacteria group bacterium]